MHIILSTASASQRPPEHWASLQEIRYPPGFNRARLDVDDKCAEVLRTVAEIFESNHRCYGYRRMQASLDKQRTCISKRAVQRLMKQEYLIAATPKRRRYGSCLGEISPAPGNLLNRDCSAEAPNEKWLTDITEFQIQSGKVYLSPMIDCFDGMVVSWSIGTRPRAQKPSSSTRCSIPPSKRSRSAVTNPLSTLTAAQTTDGLDD